jgi:hypothetical protein
MCERNGESEYDFCASSEEGNKCARILERFSTKTKLFGEKDGIKIQ